MKRISLIKNGLKLLVASLFGVFTLATSCTKYIPDDLDALSDDILFTTKEFSPYIGRVTNYENILSLSNKSTLPLSFKIMDVRTTEGESAPELMEKYPVKVWTGFYNAEEKSIEEIEAKRRIEYRSILEVQHKNGDLIFWNTGNSSFIKTLPSDGYVFDIEIANTGGRKYERNLVLKPRKEKDYEPSQYDDELGIAKNSFLRPSGLINVYGKKTGLPVFDTRVYIFENKEIKTPGNSFTLSVIDSLGKIIDVEKFNKTDFEHLVHGFNKRFEGGKVIYDVAYPMPLINYPSRYTNTSGDRSRIGLRYSRIVRGGLLQEAAILFDFAIYREGHWEIQVRFNGETPNFDNEQ